MKKTLRHLLSAMILLLIASKKISALDALDSQVFDMNNCLINGNSDRENKDSQQEESEFKDKASGDWGGLRKNLKKRGVEIGLQLTPEIFDNFQGGRRRGSVGALITDLRVAVDTERAFGWKGGMFYLDLQNHAGKDPTRALVGDLQVFDQYNYSPFFEIFELWYQQTFWKDKCRLKIGKVEANTEFSVIDNGLSFLNASTQVSPTVLALPINPDHPQIGVNIFFTPVEFWKFACGVYTANRVIQLKEHGALILGEMDFFWKQAPFFQKNGNLKLGVWGHTGTLPKLKGGEQHGAMGYYIILNQTLWKPQGESENGRGIRSFLVYGHTQKSVGEIDWNLSSGITWTGFLECRKEDILGFSPNYAHISSAAGTPYSYELALEGIYRLQITEWASLTNDLQYIIHPGGRHPNALTGTLHFEIHF